LIASNQQLAFQQLCRSRCAICVKDFISAGAPGHIIRVFQQMTPVEDCFLLECDGGFVEYGGKKRPKIARKRKTEEAQPAATPAPSDKK
jgi:hypothetical protein